MAPADRRALPELCLEAGTRVVADLHLDAARAEGAAAFVAWLDGLGEAPRLVILGDLFDAWVGPAHARLPGGRAVVAALARANARGTALELVPGNRDFLLDAAFERGSGVRLHPGGFVGLVERGGAEERALFVHGDELCTLDRGYLRLRRVLRSGPVAWLAPRVPLALATRVARRLRRASREALAVKPAPEKAMQADAARALARLAGASVLVCGHAHEFRDEALADGPRWVVLDAFGGARDQLEVRGGAGLQPGPSGVEGLAPARYQPPEGSRTIPR